jgi:GNAT superfamily N-acetyltransferase
MIPTMSAPAMRPSPTIRQMTPADVDATADAYLRDHWGDRRVNLSFVASHPGMRPFVADADWAVVGTGVLCINGPVGWIGTVWVEPAWRRRGIATALTQAMVEAADDAGCRTLVLVATSEGRPLYERFGFAVETSYIILQASGLAGPPVAEIRAFEPTDLDAMLALDAAATGEDRAHLLRAFATADSARVHRRRDGSLGGYVVRAPWGGGATIAPRLEDATAILRARRIASGPDGKVSAGLLAENISGLERLAEEGWTESWRAPRLIRGDPLTWDPTAIWGQFNFAIG